MSGDNVWSDDWDPGEDWSGGGARSKRLPRGPELGASVYELGPGNWIPFHFHHASEELLVVLRGRPTLRARGYDSSTRVRLCTFRWDLTGRTR